VPLVAGNNHIRLVPTSSNTMGGPNFDQISFTNSSVSAGSCSGAVVMPSQSASSEAGTPTPTPTETPAMASNPAGEAVLYPNPADGTVPVKLHGLGLSGPSDVKVQVFTLSYRKVGERVFDRATPGAELELALVDRWGTNLANGLYYVVVSWNGGHWTGKLIVLR
jgi:hypothetical protein